MDSGTLNRPRRPQLTTAGSQRFSQSSSSTGTAKSKRSQPHLQKRSCCSSTDSLEATGDQTQANHNRFKPLQHGFSQVFRKSTRTVRILSLSEESCLCSMKRPDAPKLVRRCSAAPIRSTPELGPTATSRPPQGVGPDRLQVLPPGFRQHQNRRPRESRFAGG